MQHLFEREDARLAAKFIRKRVEGPEERVVGDLNEAICDWVLAVLERHGYRAREVDRGGAYFAFGGDRCSVVSFRLSRVWPRWRFGLWIHSESLLEEGGGEKAVVELFCQHDSAIDKFKPSASDVSVEIDANGIDLMLRYCWETDWDGRPIEPWPERQVAMLADQVRLHPFLSYDGATRYGLIDHRVVPRSVRYMATEACGRHHDELAFGFWARWAERKVGRASSRPYVASCVIEHASLSWYPAISIVCTLHDDPRDEWLDEMQALFGAETHGRRALGSEMVFVQVQFKQGGEWMQLNLGRGGSRLPWRVAG